MSDFPLLIDLSTLTNSDGFRLLGEAVFDRTGTSNSSAGDINGDGIDDLIVGAPSNDTAGSNSGTAYVVFGKTSGNSDVDLATLTPSEGFSITGAAENDFAGRSVSSAGDVNGDGFDDFVIASRYNDDGGSNAGKAYVIFGRDSTISPFSDIDLANLSTSDGFSIQGEDCLLYTSPSPRD